MNRTKARSVDGGTDQLAASEPSLDALLQRLVELSGAGVDKDIGAEVALVLDEIAERMAARDLSRVSLEELYLGVMPLHPTGPASDSAVLVTATGLNLDGDPEPVAFVAGDEDDVAVLCGAVLQDLRARGLRDVRRVLSPADLSVRILVPWFLPGARWVEVPPGETPAWLAVPTDADD